MYQTGGVTIESDAAPSLEKALIRTQSDAEALIKAAAAVGTAARRLRAAAQVGNLREMRPSLTAAERAIAGLRHQFANARDGWDFDEDAYFGNGSFLRELRETAERLNVRIYEQDDRLYCYPSLVRVLPDDRAVEIDKKRERRLRPTVLVDQLRTLQRRSPRFKPEPFLEALFDAYETFLPKGGRKLGDLFGQGRVIRLLDIYRLLTLLPGQSREYSRPEFARDIYLLDQSGVTKTRAGHAVSFPGPKTPANTIRIITQEGHEKLYYAIAFTEGG